MSKLNPNSKRKVSLRNKGYPKNIINDSNWKSWIERQENLYPDYNAKEIMAVTGLQLADQVNRENSGQTQVYIEPIPGSKNMKLLQAYVRLKNYLKKKKL